MEREWLKSTKMVNCFGFNQFFFSFNLIFSIKWRSNVDSLDDNFGKHISRFLDPTQLAAKQQYKAPILFVGGSKSDYLT